jgi:hypothetical protein
LETEDSVNVVQALLHFSLEVGWNFSRRIFAALA